MSGALPSAGTLQVSIGQLQRQFKGARPKVIEEAMRWRVLFNVCCEESAGADSINELLEVWAARRYPFNVRCVGYLLIDFGIGRQADLRQDFSK
jgi:hypothetical protein